MERAVEGAVERDVTVAGSNSFSFSKVNFLYIFFAALLIPVRREYVLCV